jgi:hypothetical protein
MRLTQPTQHANALSPHPPFPNTPNRPPPPSPPIPPHPTVVLCSSSNAARWPASAAVAPIASIASINRRAAERPVEAAMTSAIAKGGILRGMSRQGVQNARCGRHGGRTPSSARWRKAPRTVERGGPEAPPSHQRAPPDGDRRHSKGPFSPQGRARLARGRGRTWAGRGQCRRCAFLKGMISKPGGNAKCMKVYDFVPCVQLWVYVHADQPEAPAGPPRAPLPSMFSHSPPPS